MKSISAPSTGYYKIFFYQNSIVLTSITDTLALTLPEGHFVYLYQGWYIEGDNYTNWFPKDSNNNGSWIITDNVYTNINNVIPGLITYKGPQPEILHTCKDFKLYQGLIESYEYCKDCDKKR